MSTFTGCLGWETRSKDGTREAYYLGLTRVEYPAATATSGGFEEKQVSSVGIGAGPVTGLTLGYVSAEVASAGKADRRTVYIWTQDPKELQALQPFFQQLRAEGYQPCIIQQK